MPQSFVSLPVHIVFSTKNPPGKQVTHIRGEPFSLAECNSLHRIKRQHHRPRSYQDEFLALLQETRNRIRRALSLGMNRHVPRPHFCRPSRAPSHNAHVPGAACVAPRRPDPWLNTDAPSGACPWSPLFQLAFKACLSDLLSHTFCAHSAAQSAVRITYSAFVGGLECPQFCVACPSCIRLRGGCRQDSAHPIDRGSRWCGAVPTWPIECRRGRGQRLGLHGHGFGHRGPPPA